MNTADSPVPAAPAPAPVAVAVSAPDPVFRWLRVGILLLAAILRLWDLELRPPHFDEGVNGWFTDQMQHLGCYQYDPHNYHGPLHFYVLFLFVKTLFGRHLWALRLPVVIVGVLSVDWTLRFERFLGRRTSAWAALAMAVSPGFLYYQRDAIHETWLVFFLILAFWGVFGLWQDGGKRYLWALGMGLTGAILTKETYLIHIGCFVLAVPCLLAVEALYPSVRTLFVRSGGGASPPAEDLSSPTPLFDEVPPWASPMWQSFAPQAWRSRDAWTVAAVGLALILFFYSGNGLYLYQDVQVDGVMTRQFTAPGLTGLVSAFEFWGKKSQEGEGHNKPFLYWARLLINNEPAALFGMLACFFYAVPPLPRSSWRIKWLGIGLAVAALAAFVFLAERYPTLQGVPGTDSPDRWNSSLYLFLWGLSVAGFALGVACWGLPPPRDWRVRLLAIYGLGNFVAYSLIPYKTPWCAISFAWPFLFVGGAALSDLAEAAAQDGGIRRTAAAVGRAAFPVVTAVVMGISAFLAVRLNFFRPTQEKGEDYVYVQTFPDMWKIVNPMRSRARKDPTAYHQIGTILCGSTYPLPWLLGDFTKIGYYSDDASPPDYRGDFLLVLDSRVAEVEVHLDADYFKETVHLRSAQNPLSLYFRADRFAGEFPGRKPEFHPSRVPTAEAVPAPAPTADPMQ